MNPTDAPGMVDTQAVDTELSLARPGTATFDERRAKALVAQRLFGNTAARPTRLERYVVSARLGSGGNGVVYKAWDPLLRRFVALKVLRRTAEDVAPRTDGRALLLQESRRSAKVEHPNVARVYAVGREPNIDAWFIVMELLPGHTLRAWAEKRARSESELRHALAAAALGLDAAHLHGVTHGDFKPDNVLFDAEHTICVADFGGRGTPRYLAPEVAAGAAPRPSADIYAFAVTVHELWGSRVRPKRFENALARALSPDPSRRPSSASALMRTLRPRGRGATLAAWGGVAVLAALGVGVSSALALPCALDPLAVPDGFPSRAQVSAEHYVASWNLERDTYCAAPKESALRCLEQTRQRWDRVAALVLESAADDEAPEVIEGLAAPSTCVSTPTESTSPLREAFHTLEVELHASEDLGMWAERGPALRERLAEIRRLALATGDVSVEADATLYEAYYEVGRGAIAPARANFEAAYLLGMRAEDPDTAFFAAGNLVRLHAEMRNDPAAARPWVAAAERAGRDRTVPDARGDALAIKARFALATGDFEHAIPLFDLTEAAYSQTTRADAWVELHCGRGRAYRDSGQSEAALVDFERGLGRLEALGDADTLTHGCLLNGIGTTARLLNQPDKATTALERLLRLLRRENPESPDIAAVLANLAQLNSDNGEHALALERFRQVHAVFVAFVGPEAAESSVARYAMAAELLALDRDEDARVEAEAALRWSVPEPYASASQLLLARLTARRGEEAEALELLATLEAREDLPEAVREELTTFRDELNAETP